MRQFIFAVKPMCFQIKSDMTLFKSKMPPFCSWIIECLWELLAFYECLSRLDRAVVEKTDIKSGVAL
jgi:hypothetical protein